MLHRAQALAALMQGRAGSPSPGANGKTTTTSMLTVALQACGVDPSFAVGGELAKHGTNAHHGTGDVFVAEADESDGSFLVYRPEVAIVTNVQPDHLDFYGTSRRSQEAYGRFAAHASCPAGCWSPAPTTRGRVPWRTSRAAEGIRVLTYGFAPDADVRLAGGRRLRPDRVGRLHQDGAPVRRLQIGIPGRHNLLNATAAFLAGTAGLGAGPGPAARGPGGVHRHPPPVRAQGRGRRGPGGRRLRPQPRQGRGGGRDRRPSSRRAGRLVVVFQPHLYSRTRDFADELAALAVAGRRGRRHGRLRRPRGPRAGRQRRAGRRPGRRPRRRRTTSRPGRRPRRPWRPARPTRRPRPHRRRR